MDWDRLKTFETVARLGSLTAASEALGISQSTVSRHIRALEEQAGSPLLLRESPIRLTQRGQSVYEAVQPMVNAAIFAQTALLEEPEIHGQVTVTTVGEWMRWVLVETLVSLYAAHPHLSLKVLVGNRVMSLAAGEADIAVRIARPIEGDLVAKKIHTESYGIFAAQHIDIHPNVSWLGLAGTLAHIPEQICAEQLFGGRPARLFVEDVESLGLATQKGIGVAVLPYGLARRMEGLVEVAPHALGITTSIQLPSRDFWMVVHRAKQHIPKIRAVIDWLVGSLQQPEEVQDTL